MLVRGPDGAEGFRPAIHLVDGRTIRQVEGGTVEYFHLMCDRHQVIFADGAPTESFHASSLSLGALVPEAREEIFSVYPDLRDDPAAHGDTARTCLKSHESRALLMIPND